MHYLITASSTVRGRITSLLATLFLMHPRILLDFCAARSHWIVLFNLVSASASGCLFFFFFFYKAAFQMVSRKHLLVPEFTPPQEFPWGNMCLICWTSLGSYLSKSPIHSSEWQQNHWEYQSLLLVLCHLQTCCPSLWVINEAVKQHGTQYWSPMDTAGNWVWGLGFSLY